MNPSFESHALFVSAGCSAVPSGQPPVVRTSRRPREEDAAYVPVMLGFNRKGAGLPPGSEQGLVDEGKILDLQK